MIRVLVFAIGCVLIWLQTTHTSAFAPPPVQLLLPPAQMKYFTFGYSEVVADTIWLRVIQDFDTCGKTALTEVAPVPRNAVDAEVTKRQGRCELSWVYRMIDSTTDLAPKFRIAYATGAVILSVAVDDIDGATRIFDKALIAFPTDWRINFSAAYHYLYETGDKRKAAAALLTAAKNGGPYWTEILAARLFSKSGSAMLGKTVLSEFIANNPDQADNPHVKQRMAEIERDLAAGDGPEATPAPESAAAAKQPTELPKKKQ
ncbi:MAG: hypothetical protein EOP06_16130 [Proteobacteria bacterium]|nr:MAG: hypothetical protein EOP06_16130 [Pseudomonadota bacterium]